MTRPAVSVVIPAWNVAGFIGEAVASVIGQTFGDWELIVVNDGSPDADATERAIAPFRDRLTWIAQENQGAAVARNAGLRVARGEFAAFLDGDDAWLPTFLESQVAFLERERLDMAYADAELIGKVSRRGDTFMTASPSRGPVTPVALLGGECHVITSGTIVRTALIARLGGFDPVLRRGHDFDLWFRLAKAGARIGYQRRVLLRHRVRDEGLSGDQFAMAERGISVISHLLEQSALSGPERRAANRTLRRGQAQLEILHAKEAIRRGAFAEARQRMIQAIRTTPRIKLLGVLAALVVAPGLVRRRLPPGR